MTTYYDDKSVHITSAEIRVDQQRHRLTDLHRIWQRRGARSWSALAGRGMVGVAFLAPVVTAILGLVTALTIRASPTVTIALIGGSILVGLVIVPLADLLLGLLDDSYDRGAHLLELWAEVRGTPVLLVSSRDALRVGRIHRALRRAVEAALDAEALAETSAPARDRARLPAAASELVREQRHGQQARRPQVQTGHGYGGGRQIDRAHRPARNP
ncbi:DUF6232 family protein [Micromonospora sp. NBC_01813]|uniref:DUF6232 family protein n=1 Tax=Micromonospora sp. NBC_01813 TaxID=2975988 RepID=UPI002DDADA80|nr:DUF6232 family protein [Micromonospora sp. NBC_01813]WSA11940.1 DUF6232 family protein [Micromonospora sp. NBC_01813]